MERKDTDTLSYWQTSPQLLLRQPEPEQPYFTGAFDFLQAWRNEQETFMLQTSGSTGTPKPILVTRGQLLASAGMTGKALALGPGTRALVCLNISYIAGLMMLVRGMELGWELTVVEPSSDPFENVPGNAIFDFIAMVPMQLSACLDSVNAFKHLHADSKILLGGAPVGVFLQKKIKELPVAIYQSYGMTETVSHVALRRLNGAEPERYTFLPDIKFGTDARGCLWLEGAVTNGERVQTNDLVEIHGNHFEWIGRADNVINSGGVKIVLDQIDHAFAQILAEMHCGRAFFCWFQPDEKLGQKLVLILEGANDQALAEQVSLHARQRLSTYENPKHIYFTDRFIKTATDKVDKRATMQHISTIFHG